MKKYLKLMRIHHYLKNILVFLPLLFGGMLFNVEVVKINLLGFLSFCFSASFIYVINDIADVEQDKLHPIKCKRPIASGDIEKKNAIIFSIFLLVISAICNYFACMMGNYSGWILWGIYILMNFAYSFGMKKVPIVDVIILAAGFLVRVMYGVAIGGIKVSNWLCFTVLTISLYLGLGKRRNELKNQGECVRKVLKYYNYKVVNMCMYMLFLLTLAFYTLWCVKVVAIKELEMPISLLMYSTIAIVFTVIARYSKDIEGKADGDPINVILKDKILLIGGLAYAVVMYFIVYK